MGICDWTGTVTIVPSPMDPLGSDRIRIACRFDYWYYLRQATWDGFGWILRKAAIVASY